MRPVPITEVRRNFGVFHDMALRQPVPVAKHGHETLYLISAQTYRDLVAGTGESAASSAQGALARDLRQA